MEDDFPQLGTAICVLKEVIRLAPNLSDPYHTLALIYTAMSDKQKALNFYMIAAHLTQGFFSVETSCRPIYVISSHLYKKCGKCERAVCMLEDSLRNHVNVANLSVVDLLASVLMETNAYARALEHIDRIQQVFNTGNEIPLHLIIKAGICHVHLGHLEKAEAYFNDLKPENASTHPHLIIDVADSLTTVGHYESALKYYMMLEEDREKYNVKVRRRLSTSVLSERVKVLDDHQTGSVFHGFRPVACSAALSKASRAKKLLQKRTALREAQRAASLAAGIDWNSDDSDNESPLCKSLSSLRRYWEALEIINLCLKLECNILSVQTKEELRTLGAQISYNIADPTHGWDCVRYIVSRHPYSFSAWNCYFKGILRHNRLSRRNKFLHNMRVKHKDSVPPILITAHQFTMISQHQGAAREYLEAFKLMPENPLINLCVGTALINLALGHRLQNKHQAVLQGLAFLYNNSRICGDSQEAFYNIARAYHHVGLVSLAATYYEKVLAIREKDYPIPILPNDNPDLMDSKKPGYCDLRREAAYNLHLIYKKSGALDLARQVLKDHPMRLSAAKRQKEIRASNLNNSNAKGSVNNLFGILSSHPIHYMPKNMQESLNKKLNRSWILTRVKPGQTEIDLRGQVVGTGCGADQLKSRRKV
ncbi:hypothetical protein DH2020_011824 [Rehmannia glutinosa]|uniref:Uncharacterized protein n=1 Tax=Rehmannia glutinosa TaxID=99300 RepID=A0ABR0XF79_REHGL